MSASHPQRAGGLAPPASSGNVAVSPLPREEYIEQVHLFGVLAERMKENMPAQDGTNFGVYTVEGYLMPRERPDAESSRGAHVELVPGETTEQTIRMDPPE